MLCKKPSEFHRYYLGNDFNVSSCFGQSSPDMLFCLEQFAILLEIDEYGHRSYTKLEEAEHIYRHQALGAGQPWVAAPVRAATRTGEGQCIKKR